MIRALPWSSVPDHLAALGQALADRYVLEREIGRGGMAIVYVACDRKHDRQVALKVLHPQFAATLGPERFQREIKLAARLQHPHILTVHDSGDAGGQLWFTMPFVEGETLRDRINREKQLPVEEAVRIARELALALQYAHDHNVIHRDVKPANILLTRDGTTLLADFGIARLTAGETSDLTEAGLAIGTPGYMSPEQATGDQSIDARSDLYSLACVIYEMLAGETPYTGLTHHAIIAKQLSLPIPSVRLLRPNSPEPVDRALQVALSPIPSDRFASAKEFCEALTKLHADPLPRFHSIAVLPFTNLSADSAHEYFSDGMTEELINALSMVPSLRVAARTSAFAYKGKHIPIPRIGAELQVGTVLEGSVRWSERRLRVTVQLVSAVDGYQLWSEQYEREMADVFAIQSEISDAIVRALRGHLKEAGDAPAIKHGTNDLEAYHLYLKGRYSLHAVALPQALTHFNAAIARDPGYAQARAGLADTYSSLGLYGFIPSLVALQKARVEGDHAVSLDDSLAEAHEARAKAEILFGWDFRLMERSLQRAIMINPKNPVTHVWLGLGLVLQGRFEEAKAEVALAFELEPMGPGGAVMGVIQICAGDIPGAIATCQRILEFNPHSVQGLWVSGLAYMAIGDTHHALPAFERAVALTSRSSVMLGALGAAMAQAGHREQALAILDELQRKAATSHVPPSACARIQMYLGRVDEVFASLDRAFEQHDSWVACIAVWPGWEQIRRDPRYTALLHRHGLDTLPGAHDCQ